MLSKRLGAALFAAPFFIVCYSLYLTGTVSISLQRINSVPILLLVVLVYPVCEEIIFRGLLQGELLKVEFIASQRWRMFLVNVSVSICFAVVHAWYFNTPWAMLVFFPSLIFGCFFQWKRRLTIPIVLHGWYNLVGLLLPPLW